MTTDFVLPSFVSSRGEWHFPEYLEIQVFAATIW